jgi:hypothetical protein
MTETTLTFAILAILLVLAALGIFIRTWLMPIRDPAIVIGLSGASQRRRRHPTVYRGS